MPDPGSPSAPSAYGRAYRRVLGLAFPRSYPERYLDEAADLFDLELDRRSSTSEARAMAVRLILRAIVDGASERLAAAGRLVSRWVVGWALDIRVALRRLRRSPGSSLVAVASITAGVSLNAVLFSAVNAFLLRPLAVEDPEAIVRVFDPGAREALRGELSIEELRILDREATTLEGVAGAHPFNAAAEVDGFATVLRGEAVTSNYFEVIGVSAEQGRRISSDASLLGEPDVVLVSEELLSAIPGLAVGETLRLNRTPFTVVGVIDEAYGGLNFATGVDLWLPAASLEAVRPEMGVEVGFSAIGRMRAGVHIDEVDAEIALLGDRLIDAFDRSDGDYFALPERAGLINPARPELVPLAGTIALLASGLVLLVACLNVAGLALVRAAASTKDLVVRSALGAGRAELLRQAIADAAVLVAPAGIIALALAWIGAEPLMHSLLPFAQELDVDFSVDGRVVAFLMLSVLGAVVAVGLLPGLHVSGRRGLMGTAGVGVRGPSLGAPALVRGVVIGQIAFSAIVLVIGGLFVQTTRWYATFDPGFLTQDRVAMTLDGGYLGIDPARADVWFSELAESVASLPGIDGASVSRGMTEAGTVDLLHPLQGTTVRAEFNSIDREYLSLLGISIVEGRDFEAAEAVPHATLVNETLASSFWPDEPAVGRTLTITDSTRLTVIGVVADIQTGSFLAGVEPLLYRRRADTPSARAMLLLHSDQPWNEVVSDVRRVAAQVIPGLPIAGGIPLSESVFANGILARSAATIGLAMGLLALGVAAIGAYGLLSFLVQRRTDELSVRRALGATSAHLFRLVVLGGVTTASIGVLLGLPPALLVGSRLGGLTIGASTLDAEITGGLVLFMLVVVGFATVLPGVRASNADPSRTLRG